MGGPGTGWQAILQNLLRKPGNRVGVRLGGGRFGALNCGLQSGPVRGFIRTE